jgi:hypothetical protein
MKQLRMLGLVVLAGAAAFITATVVSQDRRTTTNPTTQGLGDRHAGASAESKVDAWVRYAMPGKQHQLLSQMVGSWDTTVKYWMAPDGPPAESRGTCERKWILGGRFLQEEFDGGSLGLPFRGLGLYGYDRFEQKYTSVWLDTMSTAILSNLGVYDEAAKVVNFRGRYGDPWTGVKKESRGVVRFVSEREQVLEMYWQTPGGREFKLLEIGYTRKATGPKDNRSTAAE